MAPKVQIQHAMETGNVTAVALIFDALLLLDAFSAAA